MGDSNGLVKIATYRFRVFELRDRNNRILSTQPYANGTYNATSSRHETRQFEWNQSLSKANSFEFSAFVWLILRLLGMLTMTMRMTHGFVCTLFHFGYLTPAFSYVFPFILVIARLIAWHFVVFSKNKQVEFVGCIFNRSSVALMRWFFGLVLLFVVGYSFIESAHIWDEWLEMIRSIEMNGNAGIVFKCRDDSGARWPNAEPIASHTQMLRWNLLLDFGGDRHGCKHVSYAKRNDCDDNLVFHKPYHLRYIWLGCTLSVCNWDDIMSGEWWRTNYPWSLAHLTFHWRFPVL